MSLPKSEADLVRMAAQCSDRALQALLDRHRPVLRMTAAKFGETAEDRDDVAQMVVERLLEKQKQALRRWEPIAPFAAYLTTIATRAGARFREQRGRLPTTLPLLSPGDENDIWDGEIDGSPIAHTRDAPDAVAIRRELAQIIGHAVQELSDRDRMIVQLRFGQGLDNRGIAKILGLSEGTARKAAYDALRRLERVIDSKHADLFPDF